MHYRALGRTGWNVSAISFGAWAIGGAWGSVSDAESMAALHEAIDKAITGCHRTSPQPTLPTEDQWAERVAQLCHWV